MTAASDVTGKIVRRDGATSHLSQATLGDAGLGLR